METQLGVRSVLLEAMLRASLHVKAKRRLERDDGAILVYGDCDLRKT